MEVGKAIMPSSSQQREEPTLRHPGNIPIQTMEVTHARPQ